MIHNYYTGIKKKSKGIYKKAKSSVPTEEITTDTAKSSVSMHTLETTFQKTFDAVYPKRDTDELHKNDDFEIEIERIDFHLLRNNLFQSENKHCEIIESTYLDDLDILIIFGTPPGGELKDNYCIWQYKDYCTGLKFVGKKDVLFLRYKKYCTEVRIEKTLHNTGFEIPSNDYLKFYKDRLESDGSYHPKKQLNIFGEE